MKPADSELLSPHNRAERWAADFPFDWDADDAMSRRQLLRWAVMVSGALFAATAGLAGLSFVRDRRTVSFQRIIAASEVQVGEVHYFNYPATSDPYPNNDHHGILLRLTNDRFVAYNGKCTHLSCAVYWNASRGVLHCPCHNGVFDPETGEPTAGPPTRPLPKIALQQENGVIYALQEAP